MKKTPKTQKTTVLNVGRPNDIKDIISIVYTTRGNERKVYTEVITSENTDYNGDGKPDDCSYDPDPIRGDTLSPPVA